VGGKRFPADLRPMGSGSHSRGWLIAVTGQEPDSINQGALEP
jgi:hypothetical protein